MRTLFHIGTAKTGSTALQVALYHSADYLAEHGILYPSNPVRQGARNHRIFATQIAPLDKLPRHMARLGDQATLEAEFQAFHAHLVERVRAQPPRLLLMSAETMSYRIEPDYRARIRRAFDALETEPAFAAYVRRPAERYVSGLQQHLRAAARIPPPRPAGIRDNLERYEAVFGAGCVAVHLFHRAALRDGDVVSDFAGRYLEHFGIDRARLVEVGERNASLSAESMSIMQAFRRDFLGDQESQKAKSSEGLRAALRAADRAVGAGRPRLKPEIAEAIDYCTSDPLWLREHHGITFPDFDYARLERGDLATLPGRKLPLEEIVVIDAGVRRAILEALAASSWAKRKRRRSWLAELKKGHAPENRGTGLAAAGRRW